MPRAYLRAALFAAAAIVLVIAATFAAHAETLPPGCHVWKQEMDDLLSKYGEKPTYIAGLDQGRGVLTITLNPDTGTWTMIIQPNAAVACVIASGDGWAFAPPAVRNPPVEDHPAVPKMREYQDGNGRSFYLVPVRR